MHLLDLWLLILGALLLSMAVVGPLVERLPLTPAIVYLAAGYAVGPGGLGLHSLHPVADALTVRVMSEIAVSISLFAVGLKMRVPMSLAAWRVPLRLGVPAMLLTIVALAAVAWLFGGFSFPAALILASILAPTDPVLGSDVQVDRPGDRDQVRFGLTAEGGLNDGLAMPGVLLGLGLAGLHEIGEGGRRWLLMEALWLPVGGLLVGWLVGSLIGRLVLYLHQRHRLAMGQEEFLVFGAMGVSFGAAGAVHASTFLSVFAAGVALRQLELHHSASLRRETDTPPAAADLTHSLLNFNTRIEHIAEFLLVMVVGSLLAGVRPGWEGVALAAFLFLVARPAAVAVALAGTGSAPHPTRLIGWFGIRGIGSVYYLAFAIAAGLPRAEAERLAGTALTVIALSIVLHGISATPLMQRYRPADGQKAERAPGPDSD